MKKVIKKITSNKKNLIYPFIVLVVVIYKYGLETAFYGSALLYAMFMTIFNSVELYLLMKIKIREGNWLIDTNRIIYLLTTSILIIVCYVILHSKLRIMAISFSSIILIVLLLYEITNSLFYTRIKNNENH